MFLGSGNDTQECGGKEGGLREFRERKAECSTRIFLVLENGGME